MLLAKKIEDEAPRGSFSQYDIEVILPALKKLTKKSVYVEIGVQYGRSLYIAAKYSKAMVYGIDIENTLEPEPLKGLKYTYYTEGSDKISRTWDKGIDVLFIDGDHSYHGCALDIERWKPHVKEGGVIFFHDYDESSPGVIKAVNEFFHNVETFKDTIGNTSIARVQL